MNNIYLDNDLYAFDNLEEYQIDNTKSVEEIVNNRIEQHYDKLLNKHIYIIKISKTPTRVDYHNFSFDKLTSISRRLTNGLAAFGRIPNREFWKKYFLGGIRTLSIDHFDNNEYPTFSLNYIVVSDFDNLDVLIRKQIGIRIRLIDPALSNELKYLGKFEKKIITENLLHHTFVNHTSQSFIKMGENIHSSIFDNQFQRPHFLGILFKTI